MTKLGAGFLLIVWFLCTIVLVCTLVGMLLMTKDERNETSSWMKIGIGLLDILR